MNEAQLKAIIRQGFSLQNTADKAVLQVDQVLANSMSQVKRLVEALPEEGLLRGRAWKDLEPLVRQELNVYGQQLGSAIENALVDAEPGMEAAAIREAKLGGANFGPETISLNPAGGRVQDTVARALNSQVNNVTVKRLFNLDGKTKKSPVDQALFRTVDTTVRAGMINGTPTEEIARQMIGEVKRAGIPGVDISNGKVSKQIRAQATAMARTATQDMARQVKQEVYDANADAMEGMEYEWTTALDSRTCETCSPLDGRRWKDQKDVPQWPLHPNCRCQAVPIDPEDPFWDAPEKTAQVISETPFKYKGKPVPSLTGAEREAARRAGYYQSKAKVNGKQYYRKVETVTSDTPPPRYSDILAKWAAEPYAAGHETSLVQSMGGGPIGEKRARWFKKEYDRLNKDPQQILQAMLTGKPGAQKFIPIDKLLAKEVKLPAKRAVKKAAPKPKVVAKPAPPKQPQTVKDLFIDSPEVDEFMGSVGGTGSAADKVLTALADEPIRKRNIGNLKKFIRKNDIVENFTFADEDIAKNLNHYSGDRIKKIAASQRKTVERLKQQGFSPTDTKTAEYWLERLEAGDTSVLPDMLRPRGGTKGYTRQSQGVVNISLPRDAALGKKKDLIDRVKGSLQQAAEYAKTGKGKLPLAVYAEVDPKQEWIAVMLHETGHQVHYRGINASSFIGSKFQVKGQLASVSQYGLVNEKERFAEAFVQYILNPEGLKKEASGLYNWVDDALTKAIQ